MRTVVPLVLVIYFNFFLFCRHVSSAATIDYHRSSGALATPCKKGLMLSEGRDKERAGELECDRNFVKMLIYVQVCKKIKFGHMRYL